ncbi:hypothetical protein CFC21_044130 [Triticum aestivum]|uniref:Serpin domain-containing protein n=2 Tax=Triticum aestivum TaxID=4565 RepID=A0A3B6FWF1_WHEAT|nr:serpin-Z1-like [Triticum dicoccoides]XP_044351862.1 serpin-Z1-like [Triticum aestivum]KAF7033002.1 hypothetical protein CFC21_044130 [Triticum aestivum]
MELAEAVRCEAAFGMRVLQHLAAEPGAGGKNHAVSPLSIHAALALLGAGARGAMLNEIVALLGPAGGRAHALLASHVAMHVFADSSGGDGGPKVQFANAVWVDATAAPLKADYARVVAQHYAFKTMPEEARREINEWFEAATAGRIKEFLPQGSVGYDTAAILGNALYFKGVWESTFDARLTRHDTFFYQQPAGGEGQIRVPFMSSGERQYIACRPDYKVLKLLYACGSGEHRRRFAMHVYLPNERHGLQAMLHRLASSPEQLEADSMALRTTVAVGTFKVPKFTISYKTEASGMLQRLGLRLTFSTASDFSGLLDLEHMKPPRLPLYVSQVYHESFVEVNEEGTEAAAATAIVGIFGSCSAVCSRPVNYVDFIADHPFMFLIKEELTGVVVFAGQVVDPSL